MPTILSAHATEKSTYIVNASFFDEDDNPVIPKAGLKWTLTDSNGNTINSRKDVAITPDTSVDIVLSGDDLQIVGSDDNRLRLVTVEGIYDSAAGSDLALKGEVRFYVDNLIVIA